MEVSSLTLEHIVISCFFGMVTSWVGLFDYGNFQEKVKKAKPKKGPPTSTVDLFASDPCGFKGFVHKNNSHLAGDVDTRRVFCVPQVFRF